MPLRQTSPNHVLADRNRAAAVQSAPKTSQLLILTNRLLQAASQPAPKFAAGLGQSAANDLCPCGKNSSPASIIPNPKALAPSHSSSPECCRRLDRPCAGHDYNLRPEFYLNVRCAPLSRKKRAGQAIVDTLKHFYGAPAPRHRFTICLGNDPSLGECCGSLDRRALLMNSIMAASEQLKESYCVSS
jgi:hypothetical protein